MHSFLSEEVLAGQPGEDNMVLVGANTVPGSQKGNAVIYINKNVVCMFIKYLLPHQASKRITCITTGSTHSTPWYIEGS